MKPNFKASGDFTVGKSGKVTVENLPVFVITEEKDIIYYCPVLDVSGYGYDDAEAEESLLFAIKEVFTYACNKGTFDEFMAGLGWQKRKRQKRLIPPSISDMVKSNDYLSEIMNEHDFRKKTQSVEIPTFT